MDKYESLSGIPQTMVLHSGFTHIWDPKKGVSLIRMGLLLLSLYMAQAGGPNGSAAGDAVTAIEQILAGQAAAA